MGFLNLFCYSKKPRLTELEKRLYMCLKQATAYIETLEKESGKSTDGAKCMQKVIDKIEEKYEYI